MALCCSLAALGSSSPAGRRTGRLELRACESALLGPRGGSAAPSPSRTGGRAAPPNPFAPARARGREAPAAPHSRWRLAAHLSLPLPGSGFRRESGRPSHGNCAALGTLAGLFTRFLPHRDNNGVGRGYLKAIGTGFWLCTLNCLKA
ncbi:unnamed protein product [Natator depressus]